MIIYKKGENGIKNTTDSNETIGDDDDEGGRGMKKTVVVGSLDDNVDNDDDDFYGSGAGGCMYDVQWFGVVGGFFLTVGRRRSVIVLCVDVSRTVIRL